MTTPIDTDEFLPPPDLTAFIVREGTQCVGGGCFGDVYQCWCNDTDVPKQVAVKAFRIKLAGSDKSNKLIRRELGIWRRLKHNNIVPFLGVAYGFGMQDAVSLVSLWMPNGTLHSFLGKYDNELCIAHRLQLMLDIANGLLYLHSRRIIHGDLYCNNVLIDADRNARLVDFGFASLLGNVPDALGYLQRSTTRPGALRWAAPEQVLPQEGSKLTTKSDIYSFGCIGLQVLSGKQPWSEVKEDGHIVLKIVQGCTPTRPQFHVIDDHHWVFIERCWSSPQERPLAEEIIAHLEQFLHYKPTPLDVSFLGGLGDGTDGDKSFEEAAFKSDPVHRDSPPLRGPEHPDRSLSLNNLANSLSSRYKQLGGIDLHETLALHREALSLHPPGHPDRLASLNNLATHLSSRYEQLGGIDSLNEALLLYRESLSLHPPGHSGRWLSLNNLAKCLSLRYKQFGEIDGLNEALVLLRESLSFCPPGHLGHSGALNDLANCLSSRYELLGEIDDLTEALALHRESLSLHPPGHPDRSASLNNLANCLSSRHEQLGGIDDLVEALVLLRESLSLHPPGHPDRSVSLNNLAACLSSRCERLGGIDDLDEALVLLRESLSLHPPGHPDRPASLNNLATCLSSRYERLGGADDLNEAFVLLHESLSLHPPGHPDRSVSLSNFAGCLFLRYGKLGGVDDLNEAIVLHRQSLLLCPSAHRGHSGALKDLANCLSSRFEQLKKIGDLKAALNDKEELFGLYTELQHVSQPVSSIDLSAAKAWVNEAEMFNHPTTILAYETAIRLLVQHLAALPLLPHHLDLVKSLSSSLAADAFSACLRNHSPTKAVELLEQGRAVFWGQLTRLRSPVDYIIKSGTQGKVLADEFTRLTSLIRIALNSPGRDQHDRVCRLNVELENVVSKIRELPGLSRFLLPSLFCDLQRAARDGPVIIMNASKYSCDALVIFSDNDPIHIPLAVTKEDVRELSLRLRRLTGCAMKGNEKEFRLFLRELWDKLVSHIVKVLKGTCPRNSRIWWCPTAEFALLPLHAANPYSWGQKGVSDLYVSSYAPTLSALIHARRPSLPSSMGGKKRFIAIGQAEAKDAIKLPSVGIELDRIGRVVDNLTTFTRIEGEDAFISNVADKLGKNEMIHLSCHGIPSQEEPFESAFALHDGRLTIQRIIQCDLQNPEFAYLSACHTTVGDKESPDEVIHLAAAMQFIGFRSIIGTMWAVGDNEAAKVSSLFYKLLIDESGRLDYTRAARALRVATRKADIPIDQRVLYIHIGV